MGKDFLDDSIGGVCPKPGGEHRSDYADSEGGAYGAVRADANFCDIETHTERDAKGRPVGDPTAFDDDQSTHTIRRR